MIFYFTDKFYDAQVYANSVDPDQSAPEEFRPVQSDQATLHLFIKFKMIVLPS